MAHRFIIEFESPEEMAMFVAQKTAQPEQMRYALVNGLPQTFKVKAEARNTEQGTVILLHIVSRGEPDDEGTIAVGPGETKAV